MIERKSTMHIALKYLAIRKENLHSDANMTLSGRINEKNSITGYDNNGYSLFSDLI